MTNAEILGYWQSLPEQDQTHLARWLADIYSGGGLRGRRSLDEMLRQEVQLHRLHHEPPEP